MPSLPCCRSSSRRWRRGKGLRLHPPRLSLHRLRFQFFELVNLLNRWKFVCCKAMESLKKSKGWKCSRARRRSGNEEDIDDERVRHSLTDYKLMSYGRSNSFYAEAIAECLEFIKRNSVSSEESALVN